MEIRLLQLQNETDSEEMHTSAVHPSTVPCPAGLVHGVRQSSVPASALREILIHGESVHIMPTSVILRLLELMVLHRAGMGLWMGAICINLQSPNLYYRGRYLKLHKK
jgi:hypothetical protein